MSDATRNPPSIQPAETVSNPLPDFSPESAAAPPNSEPECPVAIGRFQVVCKLGAGGFGTVFKAHDPELHRDVAIKIPHRRHIENPEDVQAYVNEARLVAGLDHRNIVPVFDVGRTDDGSCYVVSKFIDGCNLSQAVHDRRPSHVETAQLISIVAEALHYAHRRGLVHRDIKPGNILVDASGTPFVVDFGLALTDDDFGKGSGYAGTPGYMSPEQVRGESHRVDGRSDIFSLGVVMYELLTGRRPFRGESPEDVQFQIVEHDPREPRMIDDSIPRELERICLRALAKRARDRYTTAKDLADDLSHFLSSAGSDVAAGGISIAPPGPDRSIAAPATAARPGTAGLETPPSDSPRNSPSDVRPIKVVPKGLRSFDARDADFFLELLPGGRAREGLPDSIRFWKSRIEEMDADATFSVGLLYGPSGCGKSSLIKAGLLPRLAPCVLPVYVEATATDTESRVLKGLRKQCPDLNEGLNLADSLSRLRRGRGLPTGCKVLLILDQFEQWLHSPPEHSELLAALRQCDGGHVQCLVLVRDDFWMAATRFMRELEVPLLEGQNSAAVDLFDLRHARRVLTAFGCAFGSVPEKHAELSSEQTTFLEQSVAGLAQDGKVVSV